MSIIINNQTKINNICIIKQYIHICKQTHTHTRGGTPQSKATQHTHLQHNHIINRTSTNTNQQNNVNYITNTQQHQTKHGSTTTQHNITYT